MTKKTGIQPPSAAYRLNKLKASLQKIEDGYFVHITYLMPICYFLKSDEIGLSYARFLIASSFELYKTGKSLSVENKISDTTKYSLYEDLLRCLDGLIAQQTLDNNQVNNIISIIQTEYPFAMRSIAVHATRRKIFDVDLMLLEDCARMLQIYKKPHTYWLFQMTKYFCINYENLRYKLNQNSISRFKIIIDFFENITPVRTIL